MDFAGSHYWLRCIGGKDAEGEDALVETIPFSAKAQAAVSISR